MQSRYFLWSYCGVVALLFLAGAACAENGPPDDGADLDGESATADLESDGTAESPEANSDGDLDESVEQAESPEQEDVSDEEDAIEGDDNTETSDTGDADFIGEESEPELDAPELAALALNAVEPRAGPCSRATLITLHGEGFADGLDVHVGDVGAGAVTVLSADQATAIMPSQPLDKRGPATVRVSLGDQSADLERGFACLYDQEPIVFVHGYSGHGGDFNTIIGRFKSLGYPDDYLAAITYSNSTGSNVVNKEELDSFVASLLERTGAERVDIVAHSMGAVSSRLWIALGGGEKVRDYVSLAGAHHGNNLAVVTVWLDEASKELYPAYAEQADSHNNVQFILNGDPDVLDIDETPYGAGEGGGVYWNAIYSDADIIISPTTANCLNQRFRDDCSDPINIQVHGVGHVELVQDEGVFQLVKDLLMRHGIRIGD
ncbi:MAG: hypothetical protein C4523_11250 [Myxococcales bacterium]|nr:MAG: hypothetical protein C4523_11250 [Myxococcales bacterium]